MEHERTPLLGVEQHQDAGHVTDGADSAVSTTTPPQHEAGSRFTHLPHRHSGLKHRIKEAEELTRFSLPIVFGMILGNINKAITILVVGHKSAFWLAAASLGTMYANVGGFSIVIGLTSGLETLCSQAYTGAADKRKAGEYLYQALVSTSLVMIPLWVLWWVAEPVLLALGQDPEMARMAGKFLRWQTPDLFVNTVYFSLTRFLSAQSITNPVFYVEALSLPFTAFFQWLLVWSDTPFNMGFVGSSIALVIVDTFAAVALLLYTLFIDGYQCLPPFTFKSAFNIRGWKQYWKIGVPALLMVISEWWAFEMIAVVAGWFGPIALASMSVCLQMAQIVVIFFYGFGVGVSTKIGNALGAGDPAKALSVTYTALTTTLSVAGFFSITAYLVRDYVSYIFTSDAATADMVSRTYPIVAAFHMLDAIAATFGGILKGIGRLGFAAIVNGFGYYIIAPLFGGLAILYIEKSIFSLWVGCLASSATTAMLCSWYLARKVDWKVLSQEAIERVMGETEEEESLL